jgi:Fe(3+) dicitrate transport protein
VKRLFVEVLAMSSRPIRPGLPGILVVVLLPAVALAQPQPPLPDPPADEPPVRLEELTVVGTREKHTAGSAHILKNEDLERQDHDNAEQVLKQVPGVHARGEDGLGLRPNISIRGVSPDRSKKVTLLEDGVLFGPAPYSAPAAYYFPLITRMDSVRVIKGPGAVSFGPQTVGGAVDLVTRRVPQQLSGGIDLAAGQYRYGKAHGYLGASSRRFGFLLEGVHLRTDGFKHLDGGGGTGFVRNELMAKTRFVPQPGARVHNELELKLGLSTEESDETYLGLTDADLRADPLRRYGASRFDHMDWLRTQATLKHLLDFGRGRSLETVLYRHDFDRTWRKVNRLGGSNIADVLREPNSARNQLLYRVLTLAPDAPPEETLWIGPNHRTFVSQGLATLARLRLDAGGLAHRLEMGARLHHDRIDRRHSEEPFQVQDGVLVRGPGDGLVTADGRGSAVALALHASDAVTWRGLTLTPGLRFELIRTGARDRRAAGGEDVAWQNVLIPGLGAYYALTQQLGILAGAYRGFSPAAPGQGDELEPEISWNYEAGARLTSGRARAEVIGFLNDYRNLISQCTLASGCPQDRVDRQYNGGRATIWGLEVFGQSSWRPFAGVTLPLGLAYSFTRTRLATQFVSEDPQLGSVEVGDELPYVPRHQATVNAALETARFGLFASAGYTSRMREEAGQGAFLPDFSTDATLVLEAGAHVTLYGSSQVYAHLRNLTDARDVASRRPYGARPISPRWFQAGVKSSF